MKYIAQFSRITVGLIFILSGFVKVVDPVGTGIKLHEYFDVFASDLPAMAGFFSFLSHHSLVLSVIFCAVELILGIACLLSYRMEITAWLLLLMIVFFTFLTFYSAFFNKVTDCGCFGDFLHLKPWKSFYKDLVLSILIAFVFLFRHGFKSTKTGTLVALSTVISFGIGIFAVLYLPFLEFTSFAVGNHIPTMMKPEEKPILQFIMEKDGKEYTLDKFPTDTTYKFKEAITLNEDKAKAKITDYAVMDENGNDLTDSTFKGQKLFLAIKTLADLDKNQVEELRKLGDSFAGSSIQPMILSSVVHDDLVNFLAQNNIKTPAYSIDEKILKTIARSNPCVVLLKDGTVAAKWSNNEIPSKEDVLKYK